MHTCIYMHDRIGLMNHVWPGNGELLLESAVFDTVPRDALKYSHVNATCKYIYRYKQLQLLIICFISSYSEKFKYLCQY